MLAADVYSIPLFSRPAYLLNATKAKNVIKNPTQQGSTWNAETWTVTCVVTRSTVPSSLGARSVPPPPLGGGGTSF